MNFVPLEGIRAKLSSISFGMDDKYDRLTRKTTTFMVLLGALVIASNRNFGTPISCATTEMPHGIPQHWIDSVCWITDKKFAPIQIVGIDHLRKSTSFYQCTVETLILVAVLLSLPGQLWKAILGQSGYHLKTISTLISATKQTVGCQRQTNLKELAKHLQTSRRYHRVHWNFDEDLQRRLAHLRLSMRCNNFHRNCYHQNRYFIPLMFILIKILYIAVIIGVYFVLEYCLGFSYVKLGLPILEKIISNSKSTFLDEQFFPQRTWCQIYRPTLGGTVQTWADCVLPINVINNIIFSSLWFWLIIVIFVTMYGLFNAIVKMLSLNTRLFLGQHLQSHDLYTLEDSGAISDFIRKCPPDVTLILRLYEVELGNTLVGEIIAQLFLLHKNNYVHLDSSLAEHLP